MNDDKIVSIRSGVVADLSPGKSSSDIIEKIEDLLERAKGGKMTGVAVDTGKHTELLGAIVILQQRLTNRILDDEP